jgi:hypothetical protein
MEGTYMYISLRSGSMTALWAKDGLGPPIAAESGKISVAVYVFRSKAYMSERKVPSRCPAKMYNIRVLGSSNMECPCEYVEWEVHDSGSCDVPKRGGIDPC